LSNSTTLRGGLALLAVAIFCVGCSRGPATAKVSGTVTLDGKPLAFGSVMFQGVAGGQPAAGNIQPDGTFELTTFNPGDGALVGSHRVRVVCYSSQDPANKALGPMGDSLGKLLIPERYTSLGASGLTADVPAEGIENYKIELQSKGTAR
jgi:hypothetical protein